jgi:hypothetical protein
MDRRKHSRVDFEGEVLLTDSTGNSWKARFENVSMAGILVTTDRLLPVGAACSVTITLAGDIEIRFDGSVVRSESSTGLMGVRNTAIDVESMQHLYRLVTLNCGTTDQIDAELFGAAPAASIS